MRHRSMQCMRLLFLTLIKTTCLWVICGFIPPAFSVPIGVIPPFELHQDLWQQKSRFPELLCGAVYGIHCAVIARAVKINRSPCLSNGLTLIYTVVSIRPRRNANHKMRPIVTEYRCIAWFVCRPIYCVCLLISVRPIISTSTGPIFTKFAGFV